MGLQFLSPEASIEKTYFVIPKFSLSFVGCWPRKLAPTWSRVLLFLVSSSAVAFGAFGECICGALTLNQILESMDAWCPGITKMISYFKMWIFFVHRQKLFSLIDRIRVLLTEDEDKEKLGIVQRLSAFGAVLSGILFLAGNSTNLSFTMRPLVDTVYRRWTGQNVTRDLPFKMILPDVLTHYPMYPITYICMAYSGMTTVFTFSGVDGCFLGLCFYISALFKMIQYDVRNLFLQLKAREWADAADNRIVRQKLKVIIRRHNEVIDLCYEFVDIFTTIIMGHFLSAALVLCISAINFLFNTGFGLLLYVCYSTAALTQLFLYCIGGSYVADSSLDICDSMYLVEWYKCDAETRRMILMIMIRAQRPTSVRVPFFSPSLPAFTSMLSTAGSYIALMKTFI